MSSYAERTVAHKYVAAIWHKTTDGTSYYVPADGYWDFIFVRQPEGTTRVFIAGPMTKAKLSQHAEGTELLGVRFKPSVHLPQLSSNTMLDRNVDLSSSAYASFWLEGVQYDVPTDETAELFIDKLCKNKVLSRDIVIDKVLEGQTVPVSTRSVQRHFMQTTGLTKNFIEQVRRAQFAEGLLKDGGIASSVAVQAGYADQAHMTRSFRRLLGYTPSESLST
jgi:AraC-like DNA-binding protein